ncbi:hypothetical protein [Streptomyces sp. NPDC093591]|uniref:hypothetical protein n=1 Tax=Streptomyces sp. NPDC093591 TaxID=3366044 RepID=UPI00380F0DB4
MAGNGQPASPISFQGSWSASAPVPGALPFVSHLAFQTLPLYLTVVCSIGWLAGE